MELALTLTVLPTLWDWLMLATGLLFVYPLAIYPAIMALLPKRDEIAPAPADEELPEVAFIICALNEEKVIRQKLENCLELDYPAEKLKTIFVSDGSTDATASIVREYTDRGITLIDQPKRRGKATNLNEVATSRPEPILAFSDANVMYHPQAIRRLVSRFADPGVGCSSGKVILEETTDALADGEGSYYSVEWMLQEKSSQLYAMPGADGAMYALRQPLFRPVPTDTLIEDFVIPIQVVCQGKRVVFEPAALATEGGPASVGEEYRRKVRIAAGAAQALLRGNGIPKGAPLKFWFVWISHKLLRWLTPVSLLLTLFFAAMALPSVWGAIVLTGVGLFAALAAIRRLTGLDTFVLNAPFYFLMGQVAILRGLIRGLLGTQSVMWKKENR